MRGGAIGLDLGTSGLRAALIDEGHNLLATASTPIPPGLRRSPAAWWGAVATVLAALPAPSLANVRCLAVAGTSGTILPLAADGQPLAEASLYNDLADPHDLARVTDVAPAASAALGPSSPLARALRWRARPHLVRLLHEADFLTGRLLGKFDTTDWNNALKTGFDPVTLTWPDWIAAAGFDPSLLPDAVAPGTPLGRLHPAVATALRLPPETQVMAGTTDGCAAFLATGATSVGEGVTSLGTTLTVKLLSAVPIADARCGVYSHRIGDVWLAGGASNSGGAALARHFTPDRLAALSARINPQIAAPLDYYPLPAQGERFPIADANLAPRETPRPDDDAAFLHGLLEGIAHIEAMSYRRVAELGGPPLSAVFSVGGGARNPTWTRIRARILGVELRLPRATEAAVGAAHLALRGL